MGRRHLVFLWIIIVIFLLTGCKKKEDNGKEDDFMEEGNIIEVEGDEEEKAVDIAEEVIVKEGIQSPLSGIYAQEEKIDRRPVVVMYDNHPDSRWQAGLSKAEIIYEFMVEAPYTRYMAVFLINEPGSIGPIRSSRPYFVTTLLEYDPVYVRVGGSEEAKKDIISLRIADIDGLSCSNKVLWRNKGVNKKPPHNTYSSMEIIRKTQLEKGYRETGEYEGYIFNEKDGDLDGFRAEDIRLDYFKGNNTQYIYNSRDKIYNRKKDGAAHIDEFDKTPVIAKNIIIQEVKTRVIDSSGRLSMEMIGEGKGKYITNGKGVDIKWKKENRKGKTKYYDEFGKEIVLNSGVTWIQIVNTNSSITIE